jgi:signal transduction histidine kinase
MAYNLLARVRLSAYALPLALMAALVLMVINESGYRNALSAQRSTAERVDAQAELQELQRRLLDAETGQRGFLLSARESYLEPYRSALASIPRTLQGLDEFYGGDLRRREPIRKIERATQAKLSELALTLQLYGEGKHEQWHQLMLSDIGREQMDELRRSVTLLRNVENESIRSNREALVRALNLSRIGIHLMALLALVALVLMLRKARALDRATVEHARALAAERDLLEQQVTRRTADLTELARHLQTAREDERARVARDLHDELGALLTATKLDAARLKRTLGHMSPEAEDRLKRLNATVDQGIAMKRRIIEDLRPSSLDNLGLKAALEIQAREFAQRTELAVRCELQPVQLSERAQIVVYRLVQESLTNIAKYAKAKEVTVRLAPQGDAQVRVSVRDNGVGFDPKVAQPRAHGLLGMRYRIEAEGGTMTVASGSGLGTTIEATLPAAAAPVPDRSGDVRR